jgi:hypothetical protein
MSCSSAKRVPEWLLQGQKKKKPVSAPQAHGACGGANSASELHAHTP